MEKRRRAERLIASLRWLVIGLGLAAVGDTLPRVQLAAVIGLVALYNGALTYCISNMARFLRVGKQLSSMSRLLDAALITFVIAVSGSQSPLAFLLYWFVLVSFGYASVDARKLTTAAGAIIFANTLASFYAIGHSLGVSEVFGVIAFRSAILVFGWLVSVYIAKTRSQDDLASDRGSYLHAILNCGARLASFRSVHELALYVLESAATESKAAGGELLLLNEETNSLECEAFYSANGPSQESEPLTESLLNSYSHWVMNSGREFMVRSGGKAAEATDMEKNERPVMAAPLLWQSSSSDSDSSVLGVFIVWGYQGEDFDDDAFDILRIFAAIAGAAIVNLRLYTGLQKSFLRTLQTLANGLEARDEYTHGHSERVMQVACLIAEELGVPRDSIDSLRNAALLHDIGKIGVPDAVLRKAGKLTAEEWETMRRHTIVSEEICRPLGLPQEVLFLVKHHHERLDGKGYPSGLSASEQPLLQRIIVVSDSFDAMRSRRPYRDRMPQEALLIELNRAAGTTMDPTVVDALRRLMNRGDLEIVYEEHDRMIDGTVRMMKITKKAA